MKMPKVVFSGGSGGSGDFPTYNLETGESVSVPILYARVKELEAIVEAFKKIEVTVKVDGSGGYGHGGGVGGRAVFNSGPHWGRSGGGKY